LSNFIIDFTATSAVMIVLGFQPKLSYSQDVPSDGGKHNNFVVILLVNC